MNKHNQKLPAILLTSCVIVSDHSGLLRDQEPRIRHTLESVAKWLEICSALRLVLCDGSNFDFTDIVREQFPNARIECLSFRNNAEMVKRHGKGYGEGEIITYAIQHSAFLRESEYFAKCTAKLWVANFTDCLPCWNGTFVCKGYFSDVFSFRKTQFAYVDTRFYFVTRDFFMDHLAASHLIVGGERGLSIEDCVKDVVVTENLKQTLFSVSPVICGVGGGIGTYYKNNLRRRLKERLRVWMLRRNQSFKDLFV